MGTNYYIYCANDDVTQDSEELHIGKSSSGWVFSLRVHPNRGIRTLYDWMPVILNSQNVIRDEYGRNITAYEMLQTITDRSRDTLPEMTQRDLDLNHAEFGINNLLRTNDTERHGEGTWDYCDYEFC